MEKKLKFFVAFVVCSVVVLAAAGCTTSSSGQQTVASPPPEVISNIAEPEVAASPSPTGRTGNERLAPELREISGWMNSEPFTLESRRGGNVVLIDFWTYTCINCIRTLPYLKAWHEKYADKGLVILGVHTPEFEFEKIRENVIEAVDGFEIEYAVAQDNDYGTWKAFRNQYWPAKYLIDTDGYIRYQHFGEGAYDETEQKIRELLGEIGTNLGDVPADTEPAPALNADPLGGGQDVGLTRELYAGFDRNRRTLLSFSSPPYILHSEYFKKKDADIMYEDPGDHENHYLYIQGLWRNGDESLVHARPTDDYSDYVALKFYATSVNAVMAPENGRPFKVLLTIDGMPLKPDQAGEDVTFNGDGSSYVMVDEARMYGLVELPEFGGHEIRLSSKSPEMALFAFTFGSYESGP